MGPGPWSVDLGSREVLTTLRSGSGRVDQWCGGVEEGCYSRDPDEWGVRTTEGRLDHERVYRNGPYGTGEENPWNSLFERKVLSTEVQTVE